MTFGKIGATPTGKKWTARDYVQNGMLLMFDGIENDGWGVHNSSATTWKDLGPYSLTMSLSNWSDNGAVVAKNYYSLRTVTLGNEAYSAMYNALLERRLTIEYVWVDNGTTYGSSDGVDSICPLSGYLESYSRLVGCRVGKFRANPFQAGYGYYWDQQISEVGVENGGYYRCVIDGGANDYTLNVRLYHNDSKVSGPLPTGGQTNVGKWADRVASVYAETNLSFFGSRNNIAGTLHACRIYGRALSDAEIAYNYNIDKLRFNLP